MNIVEMRCTENEIYLRAPNGDEWSITRAEILAIYATKTGGRPQRIAATAADVLASMEEKLGANAPASLAELNFNPDDPPGQLSQMVLTLRAN